MQINTVNTVNTVPAEISRGPFRKSYRNSVCRRSRMPGLGSLFRANCDVCTHLPEFFCDHKFDRLLKSISTSDFCNRIQQKIVHDQAMCCFHKSTCIITIIWLWIWWYYHPKQPESAVWCSEIGSLSSLDAPELHAFSGVREPISLYQAVLK